MLVIIFMETGIFFVFYMFMLLSLDFSLEYMLHDEK